MKKIYCDSCRKEIKKNKVFDVGINFCDSSCESHIEHYELCKDCYDAMKREIPKLLNWRNRLR